MLKKSVKKKGSQSGSSGASTCQASLDPRVQTPGPPKKKKKEIYNNYNSIHM
jgi:hypothetical protein